MADSTNILKAPNVLPAIILGVAILIAALAINTGNRATKHLVVEVQHDFRGSHNSLQLLHNGFIRGR